MYKEGSSSKRGVYKMSGYNGWKNYETWLVNIWFGDSYNEYFFELFREGELLEAVDAEKVKDHVESLIFDCGGIPETGFVTDLVNGAMSEVYWPEIAAHVEEAIQYEMENAA